MDSGNSGSLQTSSGGDEEYDSRAAVESLFIAPISNAAVQPQSAPPFFDPFSNYMQTSLLLHQNMAWSRPASLRSDPNSNLISVPMTSSNSHFIPSFQPPTAIGEEKYNTATTSNTAARNPKKRSRASRRAPTTVLTTDTTNFRAMVQEFTGIPAPPFTNSINSSFPRSRLDLFGTRSAALDAPPPYLRRPFAHKVPSPPQFLASGAIRGSSTTNNNNISDIISSTPINFQLPITTQSSNLFNINIPNPKFLFSSINPSAMAANDVKIGPGLDEFGLPNLISPDQISAQNNGVNPDDQVARMKPVGGDAYNSFSTPNFHGEKAGPENIPTTKGEGTVESWICSSD